MGLETSLETETKSRDYITGKIIFIIEIILLNLLL